MFQKLPDAPVATVNVELDGRTLTVPTGASVAAALLGAGVVAIRTTPTSGAARGPYCLMGICFECLMVIDEVPNRQACLVEVEDGMRLARQTGGGQVL